MKAKLNILLLVKINGIDNTNGYWKARPKKIILLLGQKIR